jgi:hypothetical protein
VSVDGRLTGNLANNVSDAFRPHLGAMLAITWYFAVIARVERYRSTISGHRDLAAQHHDAHVEIAVRMEIFGEIRFLTAINHLEPFAPQIALESLSRERAAIAAATGDIGYALGANLFGMQAAGGDFTALPGTECFRVVVARYGDLAAKNEQSGVEVMPLLPPTVAPRASLSVTRGMVTSWPKCTASRSLGRLESGDHHLQSVRCRPALDPGRPLGRTIRANLAIVGLPLPFCCQSE